MTSIKEWFAALRAEKKSKWNRHVSPSDLIFDRDETAKFLGFGEGTSCYASVLVLGQVKVGRNCWIGPNVILDGRGGLEIGDYCHISAGAQIYTHDTVKTATSLGKESYEHSPTKLGNGVYVGPNAVIRRGVTIGDRVAIGALSYVDRDLPSGCRAWGCPARVHD